MANIVNLREYEPKSSHHIFLDANVLIYAFAPIADYKKNVQEQITKFLEIAKKSNTSLYVTSLVLSEIYNVVLKDSFNSWKKQQKENRPQNLKKDYRPTKHYKDCIDAINAIIKNILKLTTRFPDNFHNANIDRILQMCYTADFNDCCFLELAEQKNWMIFTLDKDIINHPMRNLIIITN